MLLCLSIAAHAAMIAFAAHILKPPGINAETDAISVEIVVDAPPAQQTDASLAGQDAAKAEQAKTAAKKTESQADHKVQPDKAKPQARPSKPDQPAKPAPPPSVTVPRPALLLPTTPPDIKVPPPAVAPEPARQVTMPSLVLPTKAPAIETTPPVIPAPQILATQIPPPALALPASPPAMPKMEEPSVKLPDAAPQPRPAPDIPAATAESKPATAQRKRAATPLRKTHERREEPSRAAPKAERRASQHASSAGVGKSAGRGSVASRGGASAGEKAAYAARLHSHIQRFKRYPAEAQRQGITGVTRMTVTIDRSGRLLSARVSRGSGSGLLDAEAAAVARRASPYPKPPAGLGGATVTFAVSIRFGG